jgi:uncharacterized membrane protein YdbT with pleckstrin-like domain
MTLPAAKSRGGRPIAAVVPAQGYLKKLLAEGEEILMIAHQHGFVLFGRMFLVLALALAAVVGVSVMLVFDAGQHNAIAWGYVVLPLLAPWLWWQWLTWRSHQYVITNRRIIQLSGVLNKDVLDSAIGKITDLRTHQSWLGQMFGYGDIEVLTASEAGKNDIRMIARPLEFKRAMLEAQDRTGAVAANG